MKFFQRRSNNCRSSSLQPMATDAGVTVFPQWLLASGSLWNAKCDKIIKNMVDTVREKSIVPFTILANCCSTVDLNNDRRFIYPAAAHAQSGVKQSVLSVCLSVCQSVSQSVSQSSKKGIYFPSWAPVSSTWLFLGSARRSKN